MWEFSEGFVTPNSENCHPLAWMKMTGLRDPKLEEEETRQTNINAFSWSHGQEHVPSIGRTVFIIKYRIYF